MNPERVDLHRGVLPGCGGAAMLFAIDIHLAIGAGANDARAMMFADDVCAGKKVDLEFVVRRLGTAKLDKFVVVDPRGTLGETVDIAGRTVGVVRAAKHLGGFVGEPEAAAALLRDHVDDKLRALRRALELDGVSLQAKWGMYNVVERAIAWSFAATDPSITTLVAPHADDVMWRAFEAFFLPTPVQPTALTRPLFHLNTADGGLGITSFTQDAALLYEAASVTAGPLPDDDRDGPESHRLTPAKLKREIRAQRLTFFEEQTGLGAYYARAHGDPLQWFEIRRVTRHLAITDAAWRVMMTLQLEITDLAWPTCRPLAPCESVNDHVNTCSVCSAPYWFGRHQLLQAALLCACREHGLVASTNFTTIGIPAKEQHKPDALVMRASRGLKPLVIDFTMAHQSLTTATAAKFPQTVTQSAFNDKMRKYKALCAAADVEMAPLVLSTKGAVHPQSRELIEQLDHIAITRGFAREAFSRMKVAYVNNVAVHQRVLQARKARNHLTCIGANDVDPTAFGDLDLDAVGGAGETRDL